MNGAAPPKSELDALVLALGQRLAEPIAEAVAEQVAELLAERQAAPRLLDRRGLAQALGCGTDTVDRLRSEGMPSLRVGDVPRFELECVLAWLRERKAA